ncbi:MAG: hypothetical protein WAV85_18460, partial [Rhodoferax sp.]
LKTSTNFSDYKVSYKKATIWWLSIATKSEKHKFTSQNREELQANGRPLVAPEVMAGFASP